MKAYNGSTLFSGLFFVAITIVPSHAESPKSLVSRPATKNDATFRGGVTEEAQLFPSDASDSLGQSFGISAAIEGDWIAVGAPHDSQVDYAAGAVYIFRREGTGWVEHVKLVPDDGAWEGFFGGSLAMDGDCLVVGSSATGSIGTEPRVGYVFVRDDNGTPREIRDDVWIQETKLLVPHIPPCCELGPGSHMVTISGNRIAVGHPASQNVGGVSIFERTRGQWAYSAALVGSDTVAGDGFGIPVAISGDRVVVGAERANGNAQESGAVYVFRNDRGVWVKEAKLHSGDPAAGGFGNIISLDKNFLAIGAGTSLGARVYVFRRTGRTWLSQASLSSPEGIYDFSFGGSIFITGSKLFVWTRYFENEISLLYLYERTGNRWILRERLVASDAGPSEGYFGISDRSGRYLVARGAQKVYILRLER